MIQFCRFDNRPVSPSVHHPISLAEAHAIARTSGNNMNNQATVTAAPHGDHQHLNLDDDSPE